MIDVRPPLLGTLLIAALAVQACAGEVQQTVVEEDVLVLPPGSDVTFQIPFVDDFGNPEDASDVADDVSEPDIAEDVSAPPEDVAEDIVEDAPDEVLDRVRTFLDAHPLASAASAARG